MGLLAPLFVMAQQWGYGAAIVMAWLFVMVRLGLWRGYCYCVAIVIAWLLLWRSSGVVLTPKDYA